MTPSVSRDTSADDQRESASSPSKRHNSLDPRLGPDLESTGKDKSHWNWAPLAGSLVLIPVLLWAGYLRTRHLYDVAEQFDEAFIRRLVEFSWPEMLARIERDNHPPLYHAMLRVWMHLFGASTGAARLLSALWGIAGVAGLYVFAREAYRQSGAAPSQDFSQSVLPALVAATLLAMAPLHVFWSMQIRMYSLAVALAIWSSYYLFRAIRSQPPSIGWWGLYSVAAVLLSYTHYFGLFTLAAQLLYALVIRAQDRAVAWSGRLGLPILSASVVMLCWLPWLPSFLIQRSRAHAQFTLLPGPTWNWLDRVSYEMWFGMLAPYAPWTGVVLLQASFIVVMLCIAGWRAADWFVSLSVLAPVIAAVWVSTASCSVITAKYFLLGHAFLLVAMSVVACRMPRGIRPIAIGLLLWGMWIACDAQRIRWGQFSSLAGMSRAAGRIDDARGDEPLVINGPMLYCCALTDLRNRSEVYVFEPPGGYPYFQGTAAVPDEGYIRESQLRGVRTDFLWTLDGDVGFWRKFEPPPEWRLVAEEHYSEWYATLIVRLYSRQRH